MSEKVSKKGTSKKIWQKEKCTRMKALNIKGTSIISTNLIFKDQLKSILKKIKNSQSNHHIESKREKRLHKRKEIEIISK